MFGFFVILGDVIVLIISYEGNSRIIVNLLLVFVVDLLFLVFRVIVFIFVGDDFFLLGF